MSERSEKTWEGVSISILELTRALTELATVTDGVVTWEVAKFTSASGSVRDYKVIWVAAVEYARAVHPKWVHIYRHARKKRTRKKYEKKILKYWREYR